MTDAGRISLQPNGTGSPDKAHLLRRIASVLDLPVATFSDMSPFGEPGPPSDEERDAMLVAFNRIEDPHLRAYCLQILEGFARR